MVEGFSGPQAAGVLGGPRPYLIRAAALHGVHAPPSTAPKARLTRTHARRSTYYLAYIRAYSPSALPTHILACLFHQSLLHPPRRVLPGIAPDHPPLAVDGLFRSSAFLATSVHHTPALPSHR